MTHNRTWTRQLVADHFEEAVSTTRKLPPVKVQGYFNTWPDIKYMPNELMLMETRAIKMRATPDAISRLEQTFEWMKWLTVKERKLIWRRAARVRWKTICCELDYVHTTVWRKWVSALSKIADHLNNQ